MNVGTTLQKQPRGLHSHQENHCRCKRHSAEPTLAEHLGCLPTAARYFGGKLCATLLGMPCLLLCFLLTLCQHSCCHRSESLQFNPASYALCLSQHANYCSRRVCIYCHAWLAVTCHGTTSITGHSQLAICWEIVRCCLEAHIDGQVLSPLKSCCDLLHLCMSLCVAAGAYLNPWDCSYLSVLAYSTEARSCCVCCCRCASCSSSSSAL